MKPVAQSSCQYHPRFKLVLAARGHILVVSVLLMGVILLLGTAASFLSLTNVTIANNVETNLVTRYRAEAGVDTAIAYIQSQASGYLDNAEIDALIAEANGLSFLGNVSSCPFDSGTGVPCVTLSRWTPETIIVRAIAGDPRTNAEYVAEATIRLTPNNSSAPPIGLLADESIHLDGPVDLTGGTTQPYDDVIAHGNDGFSVDPQVTLAVVNGGTGITASSDYSLCRGGGVVPCPPETIATQSADIPNLDEAKTLILGAEIAELGEASSETSQLSDVSVSVISDQDSYNVSLTDGNYVTATQLNNSQNTDDFSGFLEVEAGEFVVIPSAEDIVFPEGLSLSDSKVVLQGGSVRISSNSYLENTHLIVESGDIVFEGDNITFNNSSAVASDGIMVIGATTFLGTSLLIGEGDLSGVHLENDGIVSREDLTIISNGVIQVNTDIPFFRAGLQSTGDILLNGSVNLSGFAQSQGEIHIAAGTIASAEIASLIATDPKYTYGFVLSRN